jgi:hypothetical protein
VALLARYTGSSRQLSELRQHRRATTGAVAVLAPPVAVGLYITVGAIVDILEAAA